MSRTLLLLAAMPLVACFMTAPPLKPATARSLSPAVSNRPKKLSTPQMASFTYTATIAKPEILQEAVSKFLNDKDAKFTPTSGGVNNWVSHFPMAIFRFDARGVSSFRLDFLIQCLQ
jgi:hypothetical protein